MAWIRNTGEPPERRPTDYAWLVVGAVGTAVVGLWAQSQTAIDLNIYQPINDLSGALDGPAKVFFLLGSIVSVAVVALLLLVFRQVGVAWRVALAGGVAWGVAKLLNEILPAHTVSGVHVNVRWGDGPMYPTPNVAAITAAALVLAPYAVRPLKRIFLLLVLLAALSAMYLGTGYPSDVLGGFLLGIAGGALVLVVFGSPAGRPTIGEVRDALGDLGYDVAELQYAQEHVPRASVVDVTLASGEQLRVDAFGRDQRDAQVVAKAWHKAMYHEPGLPVFGSRIQQAEHVGYTLDARRTRRRPRVQVGEDRNRRARCGDGRDDTARRHAARAARTRAGHVQAARRGLGAAAQAARGRHQPRQPRHHPDPRRRRRHRRVRRLHVGRRLRRAVLARPRHRGGARGHRADGRERARDRARRQRARHRAHRIGHPDGAGGRAARGDGQGRQAPRQDAEGAPGRARRRDRRGRRPAAEDQAPDVDQHRDAHRHPVRALPRDPRPHGRRLGDGPEGVRERDLGLGRRRLRRVAARSRWPGPPR